MAKDRIGTQVEALIQKGAWKQAQVAIENFLDQEPDDHWLWSRLSGVKYEQRDYRGALEAAQKALEIVPDCPLALWSKAVAVEMLGKFADAMALYRQLFRRGLEELKTPDEDAHECWEGPDWTAGLMADCMFRDAGCLARTGQRENAVQLYRELLSLGELGVQGIYSRQETLARLKKLVASKKARHEAVVRAMEKELIPS